MASPKEYQQRAEECRQLANEATEVYVKVALTELATEFQKMADDLELDDLELDHDQAGARKQAKRVTHKHAA